MHAHHTSEYEAPTLQRFGTLRQLTRQFGNPAARTKTVIGEDLIPGIGLDCDPDPNSGPLACPGGVSGQRS